MPQPRVRMSCECEQCGKEFFLKPSRAKNRRFCDINCVREFNKSKKEIVTCVQCGKQVEAYKNLHQRYCSIGCATTARNLTDANPSYHRDISGKNNPMYGKGHLLAGKNNPMYGRKREQSPAWKGGRKTRPDGYVFVYAPDHPHAVSDGKERRYVLEHRLLMEQYLGRYLEPDEVVHHIDGNPSNNVIDNLRLYESHSEHLKNGH